MTGDPHAILGVRENATAREIRKAYCELALKYHPDKNPSGAPKFREATDAYKALIEGGAGAASSSSPTSAPPSPWPARSAEPSRDWYPPREDPRHSYRPPPPPEPPTPPDPTRPWPHGASAYEPPTPRADNGRGYARTYPRSIQERVVYPTYVGYSAPSNYPWTETDAEILGQMIEVLFYEEFGVRWADLPREAQEVLLRGIR